MSFQPTNITVHSYKKQRITSIIPMDKEINESQNTELLIKGNHKESVSSQEVDSEPTKDTGKSVQTSISQSSSGRTSGHHGEGWNIIARALRNLKARVKHGTDHADVPYIDETDQALDHESDQSSDEDDVSNEGSLTPKESVSALEASSNVKSDNYVTALAKPEDNNAIEMHTLLAENLNTREMPGSDDEIRSCDSERSSAVRSGVLSEALKNSLIVILSGIYGITLVVLGLVLPLTETFVSSDHPYFFEVFYLYLYTVSGAFLIYVYTYLLRKERLFFLSFPRTISRTLSRSKPSLRRSSSTSDRGGSGPVKPLKRYNSTLSTNSSKKRKKIAYNADVSNHTGSFYLRMGVIGFGIGSMIHSALTFGHYFEVNHLANHCNDAIQAIKPFALLCFTFVQMYFIFMNSKMCVHKYKTLARFGLMHMSCTNICVWLRSIVVETVMVMKVNERETQNALIGALEKIQAEETENSQLVEKYIEENQVGSMPELNCNLDAMMGDILENSSVYLYPFTIEYSLVCACVLYVMWSNVGEGDTVKRTDSCPDLGAMDSDDDSEDDSSHHRMSVDCAGSSKGLFLGIFLFVVSVVCVVCFFVLSSAKSYVSTAALLGHISEEAILVISFIATVVASFQMREMHFSFKQTAGIEEILTLISVSGLGLYAGWSIIAALFSLDTLHGRLTIITSLFMLVQAGSQATFTLLALRASASHVEQLRSKPGRQCVTFLLICNFALWVINTFETQRLEHNKTQVDFYGTTAWSIFSHISVPLGIYFRFHSTVNLSIVWKKAWKRKDVPEKKKTPRQHSK